MVETEVALIVALLLAGSALVWPLSRASSLPFAVIASAFGFFLSFISEFVSPGLTTVDLENGAVRVLGLSMSSGTIASLLLPILLFQGGFGLDFRHMARDGVAIFTLAVVAVLVVVIGTGFPLAYAVNVDLQVCLLLAALVGTTDPSAVIAIFRGLGVPPRLVRLVEGESLFNDATALAVYGALMAALATGARADTSEIVMSIPVSLGGGMAMGVAVGLVAAYIVGRLRGRLDAQISVIIACPFLALGFSEAMQGVSGVVAVVATGAVLGTLVRARLPESDHIYVRKFVDMISSWATGLIILIAALIAPSILEYAEWADAMALGIVFLAALGARALVLWGMVPALSKARLMRSIGTGQRVALLWGGLRGAMTLALVVAVLEAEFLGFEEKRFIAVVATAFAFLTIFMQGGSLQFLVRKMGLDRVPAAEAAFRQRVVLDTAKRTKERVAVFASRANVDEGLTGEALSRIEERLDRVTRKLVKEEDIPEREKVRLGLAMLVNRERTLISDRQWSSGLPARVLDQYLFFLGALRDAVAAEGRLGYLQAARGPFKTSPGFALRAQIHYRLGVSRPISKALARRFHMVVLSRLFTAQLIWFNATHLKEIMGSRVSAILAEVLERRLSDVETEIEALRVQFPNFYSTLLTDILARVAVAEEISQIDELRQAGALDDETIAFLQREVLAMERRGKISARVDIEQPKAEILKSFRALDGVSEEALRRLTRKMASRIVPAGKVFYRGDSKSRHVFFVASGAIQVEDEGAESKIVGRGGAVGAFRPLGEASKCKTARAVRHSHLFVVPIRELRMAMRGEEETGWLPRFGR